MGFRVTRSALRCGSKQSQAVLSLTVLPSSTPCPSPSPQVASQFPQGVSHLLQPRFCREGGLCTARAAGTTGTAPCGQQASLAGELGQDESESSRDPRAPSGAGSRTG